MVRANVIPSRLTAVVFPSPAFGLALLVLVAMPVARLGEPLSRTAAWTIVIGTVLSGWVVFAIVRTAGPRLAASRARRAAAGSGVPSFDEADAPLPFDGPETAPPGDGVPEGPSPPG